ncbi:hypothetical protein [Mucilaginibacter gotjawali]|uniref:Uncharacterized protein n=2 Tax=Mucilaginibacter gotjawali TaxID=1550579 RepID=A0A839SHD4_9SPHI|nr:hypothetical protein [Mucilaginibacter gotjawali]MBB3057256.1 hypothetical protein [Mucilaginibacter gotjawali]BAU52976.1 Chromosome partition protein Smc [Mucilaginibacter gotjawali]
MADDISKKITIDVEVNTDGQQQINQYKAAFDSLRSSVNGLSNPLQGISSSISSLDKDISKLTASINKLNSQNKEQSSGWGKVKSNVTELISSFGDWEGVLKTVKTAIWGAEAAAEGLMAALTGGLAILTTFLPEIIDVVSGWFKADTTLTALNKTLKDNKIVQDAVNQTMAQGTNDAQQELVHLNLLYKASQDHNVKLEERKKIVSELQSQYPDYFGNMSSEAILNGKATKSYDDLTKAIIATARAKAAEEIITKNQVRSLGNDSNLEKLNGDLTQYTKQLKAAQKEYDDYMKNQAIGAGGFGMVDSEEASLSEKLAGIRDMVKATKKSIGDLKTDSNLLNRQNEALAKKVIGDTEQNGAKVLGVASTTNKQLVKGSGETVKKQLSLLTQAEEMRKASLMRQMQTTFEAYGSEAAVENNHYQDELTKLKNFLKNKQITQKEFDDVSKQLKGEHQANMAAIINKYNELDKEKTQQAQNELAELTIKGMREGSAKQIAELNLEQTEKLQQLKKSTDELSDQQKKLAAELADTLLLIPYADVSVLKSRLDAVTELVEINGKKKIGIEQQTKDALKKITDQEAQDKLVKADQESADGAVDPEAKLTAEKKLITDKYQFEIEQAQGNNEKIKELENERNKALKEIDDKAAKEKADKAKKQAEELKAFEEKVEKEAADAAFNLIKGTIKHASEAKITGLEQDKAAELSNTSLTSTQKLAIEQKYKQKEAQVKVKAFKEEQEASIAQAVINGALAITKVTSQTGVLGAFVIPGIIAETAIQVATIAAQKPPAYATGGVHYTSDGRGGILPGYSRTDNTNAYLRSGEGIVVSEAMQVPWARNLVSAINVGFGGRDFSMANPGRGYAVGGIFTDGGDANRYYNQPVHDQKNLANSIAYQMINNFPPVYVDVKDINNQQNILAQTINRVNL